MISSLAASMLAVVVAAGVYMLRNIFSEGVGKVIQGERFTHRQNLSTFVANIHKSFSFKERGPEFLNLVNNAIGCGNSALLLLEPNSEDFNTSFIQPESSANTLVGFNLPGRSPIADYLKHNTKPLARSSLEIQPELRGLWKEEQERIKKYGIELFVPMVSREKLIGVLLLDKKKSGRYSLADYNLLEESAAKVALSLEKEYIQEQLKERERELSIINRSSSIITSSLNIQQIYDNFTEQLRQIVDVTWTAIMVIEDTEARVLTISADIGNVWQVGERIPIKGTAMEWVSMNKESLVEPDLTIERRFDTGKYLLEQGIRTMAHIPLKAGDKVTGVLEVTSRNPNAYSTHQIKLLEELAAQIAISVENSRLFAKTEQMVRIDSLTGLLNRRSLDELITNEINRHTRYGGVFSLVILDLDDFKKINDTMGHLAGDEILKKVSHITRDAIRVADQAFRYGGDEFAILLPQTSPDDAQAIAERVRNRISAESLMDNVFVSVSLGIASWPMDALEMNELITAADTALYDAKHAGSNTSRCFNISMQPIGKARIGTIGDDSGHLSTIYALAAAVDARDRYTRSHSKKVNDYASALAEAINMTQLEKSRLSMCALLHDLGKIGVSSEILNKSGKLTDEEWVVLKKHPQIGASIIAQIPHLVPCVPGILYHHERYDGRGYPEGKKGEDIPLEARILCVADSFAAMTSERHYLTAMTFEKGIEELKRNAGTQFDPALVELFVASIKEPIRSL